MISEITSYEDEEEILEESSFEGVKSFLKPYRKVINTTVKLSNRKKMPILGFGTYKLQGLENVYEIIKFALMTGYKLFDTASDYLNERDIGTSLSAELRKYDLEREDIFIISKLATKDQCKGKVRGAVLKSMKDLMMDYIDLYLVHWPGGNVMDIPENDSPTHREVRRETWEELVRLLDEEKLKGIGVSNFCTRHLEDLLEFSSVKPVLNQVEFHPHYHQRQELLDLCEENDIFLQAYGLFGGGETSLLYDPVIIDVAMQIRKRIPNLSTAQVILRWALQSGYGVLAKATDYTPILYNTVLDFCIDERQMKMINSIKTRAKYYWDPEDILI